VKFKIEIDCSNAAFDEDAAAECASILEDVARRLREALDDLRIIGTDNPVFDTNGNRVGTYKFTTR